MSNATGGGGEIPAAGNAFVGANVLPNLSGVEAIKSQLSDLSSVLRELKSTLRDISGNAYFLAQGLNQALHGIGQNAGMTASQLKAVKEASNFISAPGGAAAGAPQAPSGGGGPSWLSSAVSSASAAIPSGGGGGYAGAPGGTDLTQAMGVGTSGKGFFQDII